MWRKGHIFLWKPANCLLPTQQSDNYLVFSEGDLTRWWGRRDLREDEHVGCSFHHSTGHPAAQLELVLCSSELLAWDFTVKWNLLMGAPWSTKKTPLRWNRPEFLIWPFWSYLKFSKRFWVWVSTSGWVGAASMCPFWIDSPSFSLMHTSEKAHWCLPAGRDLHPLKNRLVRRV